MIDLTKRDSLSITLERQVYNRLALTFAGWLLCSLFLFCSIDVKVAAAATGNNPYPLCSLGANCTWFAWQTWHNFGVDLPWFSGNATGWASSAQNAGFPVGIQPSLGSILVLQGGEGHVAVVYAVNGDTITVHDQSCYDSSTLRVHNYSLSSLRQGSNPKFIYTLVRNPNDPTVYAVYNGRKYGIPSLDVFTQSGYSWSRVMSNLPTGFVDGIPTAPSNDKRADGTLIQKSGDLTVFALYGGRKFAINSEATFNNSHFDWGNIAVLPAPLINTVSANTDGVLLRASDSSDTNTIWLMQNGSRYAFTSEMAFKSRGYNFGDEHIIPSALLNTIPFSGFIN
jgi:hypothetical protein